MYGEIPEPEVETKSPLIEEGGIYVISRFRVSNAKSGYRPVDSSYMVGSLPCIQPFLQQGLRW
jgi:replication factor A1